MMDNMKTVKAIKLKDHFPHIDFIGSRYAGELIRELMEEAFKLNQSVVLDFEHIEMITQSFADEIIGLFVREHGKDFVKDHIKIIHAKIEIRTILNLVVRYSSKLHTS
ncbi:MAG: hypothetical protein IEMM0008_1011 [bacterium]|nr:MAG: hypothetical protein IEMM0008_1011 [bacterium]